MSAISNIISRLSGAIKSGHPAVKTGLWVKLWSPITNIIDTILAPSSFDVPEDYIPPCAWIVSPPRSGSTVFYQSITSYIDCVYLTNRHHLYPHTASQKILKTGGFATKKVDFNNYYGYSVGLNGVSESNEIMASLFKNDPSKSELRQRFRRLALNMGASENRPFIFKNVRYYTHIERLAEAIPELKFIRVQRDPLSNLQSVIKAYHELNGFHPIPEHLENKDQGNYIWFGAQVLHGIESKITENLQPVSKDRVYQLTYENFCDSPIHILDQIISSLFNGEAEARNPIPTFQLHASTKQRVTDEELKKAKKEIHGTFGS